MDTATLVANLLVAVLGGAIRVGTPFLMVSLAECITEKSGRINLGLEGVLVFSAMTGFGVAYLSGSAWIGVLAAGASGALLALLHGLVCSLPRVNDIAAGIALMLLGTGLAFYLGKPLIQPQAPQIPSLALGDWSASPHVRSAFQSMSRNASLARINTNAMPCSSSIEASGRPNRRCSKLPAAPNPPKRIATGITASGCCRAMKATRIPA